MKKVLLSVSICLICVPAFSQWTSNGTVITTTQNVGIGTTAPAFKLDVDGDLRSKNIVLPEGNQISINLSDKFAYQGLNMGQYALGWMADSWHIGANSLWLSGYGGFKLFTNSQVRIAIPKSGNVGIGTENPQYKLDVNGDVRSQNIVLPIGYRMTPYLSNNFTYQERTMGHFAIQWISDSWNSDGSTLWQSGYGGIKFFTAGQFRMGINGSGNVGIGTETPQYKLDVDGDIRSKHIILSPNSQMSTSLSDNFPYAGQNMGNYALRWEADPWHTGANSLWLSGYGGIKLFTHSQVRIAIPKSGNVGIGTETPTQKLDVNGNIKGNNFYANGTVFANEVKVETTSWSDFVFDKDYKLLSLEEVKAHIEEHKHLPDVPSEKQVIEEGINIAEMQAKLLQKIEELTLYVIQQDAKNKELTLSIIQQELKNKELEEEIKELKVSLFKE